jgi:hypothetical protein
VPTHSAEAPVVRLNEQHGWLRLENALGSLKARITMGGIMALVLGIGVITTILVGRTEHDLLQVQRQREMSEAVRTAGLLGHNVVQLQRGARVGGPRCSTSQMLADPVRLKEFMRTKQVVRNFFASMCTWPLPTATCR